MDSTSFEGRQKHLRIAGFRNMEIAPQLGKSVVVSRSGLGEGATARFYILSKKETPKQTAVVRRLLLPGSISVVVASTHQVLSIFTVRLAFFSHFALGFVHAVSRSTTKLYKPIFSQVAILWLSGRMVSTLLSTVTP